MVLTVLVARAEGTELKFTDLWYRPAFNSLLNGEFGTAELPPLVDFTGHYYRVAGSGPTTVTFRFQLDEGAFVPDFGYYRLTPALAAIDTSTDAGKTAYATQALAPQNATLVFSDYRDSPPRSKQFVLNGGDVIGFFSIPRGTLPDPPSRSWLEAFQTHPEHFGLDGRDWDGYDLGDRWLGRWPFFSYTPANPGGFDQMFSLHGPSIASGQLATLLLWEDATLFADGPFPDYENLVFYDGDFNDEGYVIEGIVPIPEPSLACQLVALCALLAGAKQRCQPLLHRFLTLFSIQSFLP